MSILEEVLSEEMGRCERRKSAVLAEREDPHISPERRKQLNKILQEIGKDLRRLKRALEPELPDVVELLPCPICNAKPSLCEDDQNFGVSCSEDCPAPKCAHFDPRHSAYSWNDWVRWYLENMKER